MRRALQAHEKSLIYFFVNQDKEQETSSVSFLFFVLILRPKAYTLNRNESFAAAAKFALV